jgi:hypothetical protein
MHPNSIKYQKKALNPWIFRSGMLFKLPSLLFWGITVKTLDDKQCEVTLPFSWRSQNPFKSIYFGALAGAAELSTGLICQLLLEARGPHSMLVIDFQMQFIKKADTTVTFSCHEGEKLESFLQSLKNPGDHGILSLTSVGRNASGVEVAKAQISWSIKKK